VTTYDVVQVGYGPVGQTTAALLGAAGHRVAVLERHPELYGLPRAGHIDDEVMRILQTVGVAEEIVERSWPMTTYQVLDANVEPLQVLDWNFQGLSGWHAHYLFYQPYLEDALDRAARSSPTVEIRQAATVTSVEQDTSGATVTFQHGAREQTQTMRGRYLIGADGANSLVRELSGIEWTDLGFEADWLVVDVRPHDRRMHIIDRVSGAELLTAVQICDPSRPIYACRWLGREHCRWEVMLLPDDSPEEMQSEEACWRFLARWGLSPDNAQLIRRTVYTFRSLIAETFRRGRALLAGDAAHLMPPFLGQGMCSGIRDAINLAWKLDLVLRGAADPGLLDAYTLERRPHAAAIVSASIALGEIVCTTDPIVAAERDEMLRNGTAPPPEPLPGIEAGVLHRPPDAHPAVGQLSLQARVQAYGRVGRFDDVVGRGWTLLLAPAVNRWQPDLALAANANQIGLKIARLALADATDPGLVADIESRYAAWLSELGAQAILIRPDFYTFGVARDTAEIPALLIDLYRQLGLERVSAPQEGSAAQVKQVVTP
jgi:2-polyprenyl-6-methoxyphenol hydroxylase-like FAD-dependent oxidoreductase